VLNAPDELRRRPVGVFDSGVGGLTVLHELLVQLPHEDFVYFADAARFPYGERTAAELEAFSLEIAEELLARRIKLLVVACNSATAAALPALRERMLQTTLGVDVLGVVQPGAVQAVAATRNGRIGVMATPATVAGVASRPTRPLRVAATACTAPGCTTPRTSIPSVVCISRARRAGSAAAVAELQATTRSFTRRARSSSATSSANVSSSACVRPPYGKRAESARYTKSSAGS